MEGLPDRMARASSSLGSKADGARPVGLGLALLAQHRDERRGLVQAAEDVRFPVHHGEVARGERGEGAERPLRREREVPLKSGAALTRYKARRCRS